VYALVSTITPILLSLDELVPLVPMFAAIAIAGTRPPPSTSHHPLPLSVITWRAALALQCVRVYSEHQHTLDEAGAAALGKASLGIFALALIFWVCFDSDSPPSLLPLSLSLALRACSPCWAPALHFRSHA
jgi:hypothetical protein